MSDKDSPGMIKARLDFGFLCQKQLRLTRVFTWCFARGSVRETPVDVPEAPRPAKSALNPRLQVNTTLRIVALTLISLHYNYKTNQAAYF